MSKLIIKSEYEQIVFAEVYAPMLVDSQMDAMSADEVKKAAYGFMKQSELYKIDLMHNNEPTGSYIVESFLARKDDPDGFIEGSWVLGVKIESPELWSKVLKGELNGFSFQGEFTGATTINLDEQFPVFKQGDTEPSLEELLPPHKHTYKLEISATNNIQGKTNTVLNHAHPITKGTATDSIFDHSHRFSIY